MSHDGDYSTDNPAVESGAGPAHPLWRPDGPVGRDRRAPVVASAALLIVLCLAGWQAWSALGGRALFDDTRFNVARWETAHFFNRWLYEIGAPFRDDPAPVAALQRYFAAGRELAALERSAGESTDPATRQAVAQLRTERKELENTVEAAIEHRIATVLAEQGLKTGLPIIGATLWPPVDLELTGAPRVLAISPRDCIELLDSDLLNPELTPEKAYALESEAESAMRSAIVLQTSGVATYPSMVEEDATYEDVVETAAHEWVHQYLAFHPLGRRYFSDLRDVNETVATIAGRDIAVLVLARYLAPPAPPTAVNGSTVNVRAVLTALRQDVDLLLADGRVAEAEALMRQRQQELAAQGIVIRRINQAYFAFRGLYATSGAAAGDLGPRLQSLRERSGSVGAFLRAIEDISSRAALERVLAAP